jgi:GT2 family glycosyltransferase
VPDDDILRIPRRTCWGKLLGKARECGDPCGWLSKLERVRRKRFRALLKSPHQQDAVDEILRHPCGREFQNALEKWAGSPSKTIAPANFQAAESSRLRCSVIINTVDRASDLAITLDAFQKSWDAAQDELIVVLGPGDDGSEEVVRRAALPVRLLRCPEKNLALSRNIGLQAATGRYVAFIDDDASPDEGWLEELLRPMEMDPAGAVCAGFVLDGDGRRFLNRYVAADTLGRAFWFDDEAIAAAKIDRIGRERAFLTATGCNMAFRRQVLVETGGFDPAYAYFLEETDAVRNVLAAGFRCLAAPQSRVFHRLGANLARTPSLDVASRIVIVRSQIHYIGKFGKSTFSPEEIRACLWQRVLLDLEKAAWDCDSNRAAAILCGSLQRGYLQAVSAELRLDSDVEWASLCPPN